MDDDDDPIMKISRNGQISLPAETRRRWGVDHVIVVDLGDEVVVSPIEDPEKPWKGLAGSWGSGGPNSAEMRRQGREEEAEAHIRKFGSA